MCTNVLLRTLSLKMAQQMRIPKGHHEEVVASVGRTLPNSPKQCAIVVLIVIRLVTRNTLRQ